MTEIANEALAESIKLQNEAFELQKEALDEQKEVAMIGLEDEDVTVVTNADGDCDCCDGEDCDVTTIKVTSGDGCSCCSGDTLEVDHSNSTTIIIDGDDLVKNATEAA